MKNLLILVDKIGERKMKLANYLSQRLTGKASVALGEFGDMVVKISQDGVDIKFGGNSLRNFDFVFFRRIGRYLPYAGAVAAFLQRQGIKFFDTSLLRVGLSEDKLTNSILLSLAGYECPASFFCFRKNVEDYLDELISFLGFPLVVKKLDSHRLEGVYLLKKRDDFGRLLKLVGEEEVLFQRYVESQGEYRLLVLGNKVGVFQEKVRRFYRGLRIEIDQESPEIFLDLSRVTKDMQDKAVGAAKSLGIQIAGVDVLLEKGTGKCYVLEVNRGPGITANEKASPELDALSRFLSSRL